MKNIADPVRVYKVKLEAETPAPATSEELRVELPLPDKPSIAVLPFTNMSNDPEQEYFSDGMTDDIITDLSKISGLFVIARNSTFIYKGQAVEMEKVSRKLGVRYMLEGSVRKAGNRVRINVQLIGALTGGHVWAERYDRVLEDIFALQDEIRQKIVAALQAQLTPGEQERLARPPTANLEAYDAYLRGLEYHWRLTKEGILQARQLFHQALILDPTFAIAEAFLGLTYVFEFTGLWTHDPQILEHAADHAQHALAHDTALPTAYNVLSLTRLMQKQHGEALAAADRALLLDPNNAEAYVRRGVILYYLSRPKETIGVVEQAIRLNPHYPAHYLLNLGWAYFLAGQPQEGKATLQRALIRNPDFVLTHLFLTVVYGELGDGAEARAEAAEVRRLNPDFSLQWLKQHLPYQDSAVAERIVTALRQAGLK